MEERAFRLLRNAVVIALSAAFIAGIFVPVYSDEIGWRFQERAAIDGVDKLFTDICGPNTLAVPPFFMMPARYFSAYINLWFADPFYVRLAGILCALSWLAMVVAIIRRIASDRQEQAVLGVCALGLLTLANTPLLLIWSRPEQPLLLTATAALLMALTARSPGESSGTTSDTSAKVAWWRSLAILAFGTLALSYHARALFLVPLFLGCIGLASRGRAALLPRLVVGSTLVAVTASAASYWIHRLQCPNDPILRAAYNAQNMGFDLLRVHDADAFVNVLGKLIANVDFRAYVQMVLPYRYPMSAWLPYDQITQTGTVRWGILLLGAWIGIAFFTIIGLVLGVKATLRERFSDPRPLLSLILLMTVAGWSAAQATRHVYEAILIVPLLTLAAVLAMSSAKPDGRLLAIRNVLAAFLGLGAMISVAITAELWRPSLMRSNAQSGYIAEQPASVPVFGYSSVKPEILAAARQCGIPEPGKAKRLMIDDLTYFPFMQSKLPEHRFGLIGIWQGTVSDPIAYLKSRGSDGIIMGCRNLTPELRARAKSHGQFCCLGPPEW
jgi:hypothetical protein